jgi:hypothetical protein
VFPSGLADKASLVSYLNELCWELWEDALSHCTGLSRLKVLSVGREALGESIVLEHEDREVILGKLSQRFRALVTFN